MAPDAFTPEKLPDPWLIDSEHLLRQLALIRELALKVPFTNDAYLPINCVVDALWRLEQQLRFLLRLHRDGQTAFAQRAHNSDATPSCRAVPRSSRAAAKAKARSRFGRSTRSRPQAA